MAIFDGAMQMRDILQGTSRGKAASLIDIRYCKGGSSLRIPPVADMVQGLHCCEGSFLHLVGALSHFWFFLKDSAVIVSWHSTDANI